mmetsp:Transcript_160377/g.514693  ORF Transcript_160377/g.514693 Transcript_160377/m.514693 type:complete len:210 (-) Transcript_160377:1508-2137(-)
MACTSAPRLASSMPIRSSCISFCSAASRLFLSSPSRRQASSSSVLCEVNFCNSAFWISTSARQRCTSPSVVTSRCHCSSDFWRCCLRSSSPPVFSPPSSSTLASSMVALSSAATAFMWSTEASSLAASLTASAARTASAEASSCACWASACSRRWGPSMLVTCCSIDCLKLAIPSKDCFRSCSSSRLMARAISTLTSSIFLQLLRLHHL